MNKIFRHKYKTLSGFEVSGEIIKLMRDSYTPLTKEQERELRRMLGDTGVNGNLDMPFQAYQWAKEYPKGKSKWWRLSVIPFSVVCVMLLPVMFGCWCVTGKSNTPKNWKLTKMMICWEQNIFET